MPFATVPLADGQALGSCNKQHSVHSPSYYAQLERVFAS
jgi:hypothetical protein